MDNLIAANVKQRPVRTAVSIVGVALGVILIVLMVGLAHGLMRDYVERQSNVDAELRFFPQFVPSTTSNSLALHAGYAEAILRGVQPTPDDPDLTPKPPIPGVAAATPVGMWIQSSAAGIGFENVDGIDYDSFIKTTRLDIVEGRPLGDGSSEDSKYEVIVDRYYRDHNKAADGQPVHPGSRISVLGHWFTIVGVYQPSVLSRVKIPLQTLQELLGGKNNCTYLMIRTTKPELAEQVKASLQQYYPGNNIVLTRDLPALYSQSITAVDVFLKVVICLAIVISTLIILLAMYTTIIERTREIGILKSLGASKAFIVLAIEKEALLVSALGVILGFLAATIGSYGIESNTRLRINLEIRWLMVAAAIGLMAGAVGALYPAIRAANLDPVEALSYE